MNDYYITPEEYEIAKENGISNCLLERRIRSLGWNKNDAMTIPPQTRTDYGEWIKIAESNGINRKTFIGRINKSGWDYEKAATYPIKYTAERNKKYADESLKIAEENGISRSNFYNRIRRGWSIERASTEPICTKEEHIKRLVEGSKGIQTGFREEHEVDWKVRSSKKWKGNK